MKIETAELIIYILQSEIRNMKVMRLTKWNSKWTITDLEQALADMENALSLLKS